MIKEYRTIDLRKNKKKISASGLVKSRAKHSHMGIHSCWYACISVLLILISVGISFKSYGKAAGFVGGLCIISLVFSIMAIHAGVKGRRERDRRYLTCYIGIVIGALSLLMVIWLYTV